MAKTLTSSQTGTLYFAYGSNRCTDSPSTSAVPIAIARLDGWKWVICERGYANIVPLRQDAKVNVLDGIPEDERASGDLSSVWGVLYNMTPGDEEVLDGYEGHDRGRNPRPERNRDPRTVGRTPLLQGDWVRTEVALDGSLFCAILTELTDVGLQRITTNGTLTSRSRNGCSRLQCLGWIVRRVLVGTKWSRFSRTWTN
jgi:hypothetical protein